VVLVGTSFRTARIGTRELIASRLSEIPEPGLQVGGGQVFESSLLATCNRLEVYLACSKPIEVARALVTRLDGSGSPSKSFYVKTGAEAIRHLFRVASGLDSPVLGEEQILQQVKDAGRAARKSGRAKSILSSLFDAACSSGRRVRESYRVSSTNRSVSTFALSHALEELGHRPTKVLLIGSGETAKLAALTLNNSSVYLLSGRRDAMVQFPNAEIISRRRMREVSGGFDLIIAATRHDGYTLTKRDLPGGKRMVILDLGFPRNVDPSLKNSEFIRLYDLDDIAGWALSHGLREHASAEKLVVDETRRFDAWLAASRLTPTLANIYRWGEKIREEEALVAFRKLPHLSSHDKTIIEAMSRRLTGKLLSPHATFVKKVEDGEVQSERLLLLESIFGDGST
jgi:glutamyl-tRNA reductase